LQDRTFEPIHMSTDNAGNTTVVECEVGILQDYMAFVQVITTLKVWHETNLVPTLLSRSREMAETLDEIAEAHNTLVEHATRLEATMTELGITERPTGSDFHALLHGAFPNLKCANAESSVKQ